MLPPGDMQVYTTGAGAGAAGATEGATALLAGVAGATVVGAFLFVGAAGADGAMVAVGVVEPAVGATCVVEPGTGVTCSTSAAFASVRFA